MSIEVLGVSVLGAISGQNPRNRPVAGGVFLNHNGLIDLVPLSGVLLADPREAITRAIGPSEKGSREGTCAGIGALPRPWTVADVEIPRQACGSAHPNELPPDHERTPRLR
jgi:hypothetical protein